MSADNFWVVKGPKVWCGFATDQMEHDEKLNRWPRFLRRRLWHWWDRRYYRRLMRRRPYHVAATEAEAWEWAHSEYAEYGVCVPPTRRNDDE